MRVISPAPFLEACALRPGGMSRVLGLCTVYQLSVASTFGFVHDDRLIAVVGFYPIGKDCEEVFMFARPAAESAPHVLRIMRLAHLTLHQRMQSGVIAFRALVKAGHRPGQRLALMAGFQLMDERCGLEIWERGAHGRVC